MDISIIIVSYNSSDLLMLTLASVRRAIEGLSAEVIVVDNASTDGAAQRVRNETPWVTLIESSENIGFSRANNIGMERCTGRVVVILNPDTIVPRDFFREMISHIEAHPQSGATGVRMVNGKGEYLRESKRGYTTLRTSFFKLTGLWKLAPKSAIINAYYVGNHDERDVCTAEILSGACMVFAHDTMNRVGFFDPTYFMYSEDIDLSWRMHKASEGNIYKGDTSIIHFKGQSTPRAKKYIQYFYDSMLLFAKKYEYPKHNRLTNWLTSLGVKMAYLLSLAKCISSRRADQKRVFEIPTNALFVSDNSKHYIDFCERTSRVTNKAHIGYADMAKIGSTTTDTAIIFDIDGDMKSAIEAMRTNVNSRNFGFYASDTQQALVFFNNRTHDIMDRQ